MAVKKEDAVIKMGNFELPISAFKPVTQKIYGTWIGIPKISAEVMKRGAIMVASHKNRPDVLSINEVAQKFDFPEGDALTRAKLNKLVEKSDDTMYMPWVKVEYNPTKDRMYKKYVAAFIPHDQYPIKVLSWNEAGKVFNMQLGTVGNFIVCPVDTNGNPIFTKLDVLREKEFVSRFDMRSFPSFYQKLGKDNKEAFEKSLIISKPDDRWIEAGASKLGAFWSGTNETVEAPINASKEAQGTNKKTEQHKSVNMLERLVSAPKEKPVEKKTVEQAKQVEVKQEPEKKDRTIRYFIQGKYTDGFRTLGWHLTSNDGTRTGKYSKEQVAFLAGKGQIENCEGLGIKNYEVAEDGIRQAVGVYFKGKDCDLSDIPVYDMSGKFRNTESVGHIRKDDTAESVMNKVILVGVCKKGKKVVTGYIAKNSVGKTKFLPKSEVIEKAKEGKIGNARVNFYNGKYLLRSIEGQTPLDSLPLMNEDGTSRVDE